MFCSTLSPFAPDTLPSLVPFPPPLVPFLCLCTLFPLAPFTLPLLVPFSPFYHPPTYTISRLQRRVQKEVETFIDR